MDAAAVVMTSSMADDYLFEFVVSHLQVLGKSSISQNPNDETKIHYSIPEQHNLKVSVNDIVIKAVALALRNVPEANAYWNNEKGELSLCDSIHISIAVATDKGLITPIIRNADQKTLSATSLEVKELAAKARAGKLTPNEFQGGTFSISNLGMFPVDNFCAIINPPQVSYILFIENMLKIVASHAFLLDNEVDIKKFAIIHILNAEIRAIIEALELALVEPTPHFIGCLNFLQACILAVGRGNKVVEPVVGSDGIEKPGIVTKMSLTLSADHRVFDGRLGGNANKKDRVLDVQVTDQNPSLQEQLEENERKTRVEEAWKKMNSGLPVKVPKSLMNKPNSTGTARTSKTIPDWMVTLGIAPKKASANQDIQGKRPTSTLNGTSEEAKRLAAAALSAVRDVASAAAGRGKVEVCVYL
ncbi:hypothetical protein COCNU_scaffold014123G000010 [Cocos nucifera]|nr:hypothetical protein [Cocos nucifera]